MLRTTLTQPVEVQTQVGEILTTSFLPKGAVLEIGPGITQVWEQIGEVLMERAKVAVDEIGEQQSRDKDQFADKDSEYFWRVRNVELLVSMQEVGIFWETQLNRTWEPMYLKVPYERFFDPHL